MVLLNPRLTGRQSNDKRSEYTIAQALTPNANINQSRLGTEVAPRNVSSLTNAISRLLAREPEVQIKPYNVGDPVTTNSNVSIRNIDSTPTKFVGNLLSPGKSDATNEMNNLARLIKLMMDSGAHKEGTDKTGQAATLDDQINTTSNYLDLQDKIAQRRLNSKSQQKSLDSMYDELQKKSIIDYSSLKKTPLKRGESPVESLAGFLGGLFRNEEGAKSVGTSISKAVSPFDVETGKAGPFSLLLQSILAKYNPEILALIKDSAAQTKGRYNEIADYNKAIDLRAIDSQRKGQQTIEKTKLEQAQREKAQFDKVSSEIETYLLKSKVDDEQRQDEFNNKIELEKIKAQLKGDITKPGGIKAPTYSSILNTYNQLLNIYPPDKAIEETRNAFLSFGFELPALTLESISNGLGLSGTSSNTDDGVLTFNSFEEAETEGLPIGTQFYVNGELWRVK